MMVFVECKPDYLLVRKLGFPKREVIHAGSIGEVCKRLQKNEKCCGLVDEDPGKTRPNYMLKILNNLIFDGDGLKVAYDKERENYLIVICPRLEEWFYETSKLVGINLRKYGLPNDPDDFHSVINANIEKFERFLDDVLSLNQRRVKTLKDCFKHCKTLL